jgi:hypothetical protein
MINQTTTSRRNRTRKEARETVRQTAYTNYRTIHQSLRRMARWKHYSGGSDEKI